MQCASCGSDAAEDFAFCPRCGSRLPVACPSCGTACPPDFAFCPRCGVRLAATPAGQPATAPAPAGLTASRGAAPPEPEGKPHALAPEADRRPVTVLFADLSGFTALSERLDPEEVRALQGDLFHEMAAAIDRYEGFREKFVGDAVMAVFGAPVAHEDDPERALHAALAMLARMEALNPRWERRLGRPLAIHVGVNTGPVVAGNLGATAGAAYAVTGDTVNVASRLLSAAQAGQILVGPATYRMTQHAFAFEPLGEVAVKGKADPLPAYRVLGVLEAPSPARGLEAQGLVAPLVGRDGELGQLLAAFDRMRRGRAEVVSLIGEAGAGKSRLLREFLDALDTQGHLATTTVRRAACSSLGEQTYGVVAAFFREAYGITADDTLEVAHGKLASGLRALGADDEEVQRIAPVLGFVLGLESEEPLRQIEPEQLKRQIFLALRTLVERRLQHGPLVLVVEDLHWADAASVELLRFLVDRLAERPLLLAVAHRPTFDVRALVTSRVTHTALRLAPLSTADSEALFRAFFGPSSSRLPARLCQRIVTRAGGNPLYLEEVVRNLITGGVLVREETGWTCAADLAAVDVPPTIQALLLARLDRLPPQARRLIQEAAVLGPAFDPTLLRTIAGEAQAFESSLDLLVEAELLEETRGSRGEPESPGTAQRPYRFPHALLQEVVYQNLLVRRRTELHGRAGVALETACGERPQRLEEVEALGHHFSLSADKLKGASYLVAAGDRARGIYANADALRHYERGLATLNACEGCADERLAVRERLGDLLALVGRRDAALTHYEAVRSAAETAGDRAAHARVHRKTGGLHWEAGDRERALACFRAGLALFDGEEEHIERAHLCQEMGRLAFRTGDNQRAIEWAERALAQAERLTAGPHHSDDHKDPAAVTSHAYNTLGIAFARTGRLQEAVGHVERSVAVAEAHGLLQAACRGYTNLGVLYSALDPSRAIATCRTGLEMAKKIGDLGFQSRLHANLAVAYCALTDRCEADGIAAAQASADLDRKLGQLDHLAVPLIVLGQIHQCHGDYEPALGYYREALGLAETAGEPQLLFPCYDGLATLYLDLGDEAQAEEYMRKAQQVCEHAGLDPDSLMVLPFLS